MPLRAVLLDFRGTLVTTIDDDAWVWEALLLLARPATPEHVSEVVRALRAPAARAGRLEAPGVDSHADLHRRTYLQVFADAGLDADLAHALYDVESDLRHNPLAEDAAEALQRLHAAGLRLAIVSDIHVDIRPAFAETGLLELIHVFTLSFEQGAEKPDPRVFTRTLDALGVGAADALMVGDRSGPDGGAVEAGLTTLLLPPLRTVSDRRLHHVLTLCRT